MVVIWQRTAIGPGPTAADILTGRKAERRRNTQQRVRIAVLECNSSVGERVEIRSVDDVVAVTSGDGGVVLVGHDHQYIWPSR